jgi:DNA-binding transcriptional regulator YiaG
MRETVKAFLDPGEKIQQVTIDGEDCVLMRAEAYHHLLQEIESLDSALDLERAQADANLSVTKKILQGRFTQPQIDEVMRARTAAERVSLMREYRNLNQSELAAEAGVSQTTISNIENGRVQFRGVESARRVFSALGAADTELFDLLTEREEKASGKA